jgi:hypothetical protein
MDGRCIALPRAFMEITRPLMVVPARPGTLMPGQPAAAAGRRYE